jgi:hypothetical protein
LNGTLLYFQSTFKTSFEEYITPELLLNGVLLFTSITLSLVLFTYIYLGLKKKKFLVKDRIRKNLELWISHVILEEDDEEVIRIPSKFIKIFRNPLARQYAIDNLIINKKAFSGMVASNIRNLYQHLGFRKDSLRKLKSRTWYVQAKGIQELSMMDQNDQLIRVYRLTNSKNELVRTEAQTAIIQWAGFNGLRFLDVVSYAISEWQQVQLLVQLKNFTPQDMPKLERWLSSKNSTVIIFALKLVEVYQQFGIRRKVEECLLHQKEPVRRQAINTLMKIGDETSAEILIRAYNDEDYANKISILRALAVFANETHFPFLVAELSNSDDHIKLEAARALGAIGGVGVLDQKAAVQPEPYALIAKHIKAELLL